jgi:hypothetical protein
MAALFSLAGGAAWLIGLFVVGVFVYLGLLFLRVASASRSLR